MAVLATVCTALGLPAVLPLISHTGPTNAITVTFLMPAFAVTWGALFLGEEVTWAMVAGCAVILLGTSMATGLAHPAVQTSKTA